jgi:hypothetical protein
VRIPGSEDHRHEWKFTKESFPDQPFFTKNVPYLQVILKDEMLIINDVPFCKNIYSLPYVCPDIHLKCKI